MKMRYFQILRVQGSRQASEGRPFGLINPERTERLLAESGSRILVTLRISFGIRIRISGADCKWAGDQWPQRWPSMEDKLQVMVDQAMKGVSRRNFIKGVIAGGVAASSATYLFRASSLLGQPPSGLGERLITLNVNGQTRHVDVLKQETLAWTLRYKLGLTGTKLGCDRAECGACTVLLDDVPHYSCSVLTHTVRGRKILTIEGLANADGTLHPVQQGVIDEQGFQCAFCMTGFVMSAVGFLKKNPNPARQEMAHGLSGNLCRCQDYDKILTAMMRGAENMRKAQHV
jgi:aerobic-type carbon monoxide dehydrogenase small subunit (CoxS/CutS family)